MFLVSRTCLTRALYVPWSNEGMTDDGNKFTKTLVSITVELFENSTAEAFPVKALSIRLASGSYVM